ncbi:MAG: hypothetical protein DYG98_00575 [Haliscomenobacteraceae bacterium CHB4]|nr:hypothetical protein [Saprospiraceae bacterium]MCE7921529.1 hypothetical protein [Haliscomenobacteraceae bacterium CHB4]
MKKARFFLFFAFYMLIAEVFAQRHRLGGVRLENEKYKTLPLKSAQRSSEPGSAKSLRDSVQLIAMDQGHIPACVGYSIAQVLAIQRKLHFDYKCSIRKPLEVFSASYIFNQICLNTSCDSGAYLSVALDTLLRQGICPDTVFPNDPYGCDSIPLPEHRKIADRYKIWKYKRVFKMEDECQNDPACIESFKKELVETAIAEIDADNPVVVVLEITADFVDCPDGRHWALHKDSIPNIGHAMVLVGYDDVRLEFELLNSFGPDWCDGGFVRISYDDFSRTARYGYVMFLDGARLDCAGR